MYVQWDIYSKELRPMGHGLRVQLTCIVKVEDLLVHYMVQDVNMEMESEEMPQAVYGNASEMPREIVISEVLEEEVIAEVQVDLALHSAPVVSIPETESYDDDGICTCLELPFDPGSAVCTLREDREQGFWPCGPSDEFNVKELRPCSPSSQQEYWLLAMFQ
ncbi:uncharacterized protein EI90DRAFT_3014334 [Cantharellus anzutake]|uniref:uncharacterized protein n=1 Tax=Cantharellus anzutake TaxID=1750568 RepID=UPI001906A97D|nr:uncharacterized protein EI90DRAFT_3014334 [Cantharellus anzutake]KAF8335677.1 hypothetical protein EI90DRAFT_3014334 [Cantharellus anzutake]